MTCHAYLMIANDTAWGTDSWHDQLSDIIVMLFIALRVLFKLPNH